VHFPPLPILSKNLLGLVEEGSLEKWPDIDALPRWLL